MQFCSNIVQHVETYQDDRECIDIMINNIEKFLNRQNSNQTLQAMIEYHGLFCGYIIKVWFNEQETEIKYEDYNRIIIQKAIELYAKCQERRNKEYYFRN